MCLTIPAKIIKLKNNRATIADGRRTKTIDIAALPKARINDWILYAETRAIKKIPAKEAAEIIELLKTSPTKKVPQTSRRFRQILKKEQFNKNDIVYLLKTTGTEKEVLLSEANTIRQAYLQDFFCVHGIIEFSNHCQNDCAYCGLKKTNLALERYRMSEKEIIDTAVSVVKDKGYKLLVLQSGQDPFYDDEKLCRIIKTIKEKCRVFIFISIGDRGFASYKKLRQAGASGVLYRFETASPGLFTKFHRNGKDQKERLEHLKFMKGLGYFIATGSIIGLPGQTISDLADDIVLTAKWANMVSTGPLVATENFPDQKSNRWKTEMNLKTIAILRLMMKRSRIPVVTALETLAGKAGRKKGLCSGANSLMINLTPAKYRPLYEIYPNKYHDADALWEKYGLFSNDESYRMLETRMKNEIK